MSLITVCSTFITATAKNVFVNKLVKNLSLSKTKYKQGNHVDVKKRPYKNSLNDSICTKIIQKISQHFIR